MKLLNCSETCSSTDHTTDHSNISGFCFYLFAQIILDNLSTTSRLFSCKTFNNPPAADKHSVYGKGQEQNKDTVA